MERKIGGGTIKGDYSANAQGVRRVNRRFDQTGLRKSLKMMSEEM